jgi:hypothetical protein
MRLPPMQPAARDPMMPVPQTRPQPFSLQDLLRRPLYMQPQQPHGFASPGFADFLRNFYLPRQGA